MYLRLLELYGAEKDVSLIVMFCDAPCAVTVRNSTPSDKPSGDNKTLNTAWPLLPIVVVPLNVPEVGLALLMSAGEMPERV